MGALIFLALLAMPIVEIVVFIQAGAAIGWVSVILLTVGTALLGTFLIRAQGFAAFRDAQASMASGSVPVSAAVDGVFLVVAAPLLMTPGFVTDTLGFLLLVPAIRHRIAAWALSRLKRSMDKGTITIITPR